MNFRRENEGAECNNYYDFYELERALQQFHCLQRGYSHVYHYNTDVAMYITIAVLFNLCLAFTVCRLETVEFSERNSIQKQRVRDKQILGKAFTSNLAEQKPVILSSA